jgi:hypothetical protein
MNSALSAWYFAADRLDSRPCATTAPWLVQMVQAHLRRLRCTTLRSNIGNSGLTIAAASRQTFNLTDLNPDAAFCLHPFG